MPIWRCWLDFFTALSAQIINMVVAHLVGEQINPKLSFPPEIFQERLRATYIMLGMCWNHGNILPVIFIFHIQHYSKLRKKRARNPVPKCPCKLLQSADWPMTGSSSLEGHFGTGLRTHFSLAWSNVECVYTHSWQ